MTFSPQETNTKNLKSLLLAELPRLVECLFAGRTIAYSKYEWRIGTNGSVSIRLADGCYFNHETGEGGDLFNLIRHQFSTDFKGALVWARAFLGRSASLPRIQPSAVAPKPDDYQRQQHNKALAILKRAQPVRRTLAERYLRQVRAISLEALPAALGFVSHVHNYTASGYYPALVVAIRDGAGNPIAAHCTFLDPATGDKLKVEGVKPRLIIGSCKGGAIRLAEATERLALCEGIEDGLSVMQCSPDWPVWAVGGTSGLRTVQIPLHVREVMICADRDEAGIVAANDLSARLVSEGRTVRIAMPPEGVKDFNDLLRHGGGYEQ